MNQAINSYSRLIGFFIAFAVGAASIVIFRDNHIQGALVLVIVIAIYALIGSILFGKRERDAHGDSVYYLGFCLTLVGLSIGLLLNEDGAKPDQLINTFGFGLVATVSGLVARILIQNFAAPVESDPADSARILEESYRNFAGSVTGATHRIDAAMADIASNTERSMGILDAHLQRTMTELSTHLQRTMTDLSAQMQFAVKEFSATSASAGNELRQQLGHQAEVSMQRIEEGAGKSLSAIMVAGHKSVETIATTSGQISGKVAEAGNSVAEAVQAMKVSSEGFKKGASQVEKAAGSLDKAAGLVEETSGRLAQSLLVVDQSAVNLRDSMSKAVEPLREMVQFQQVIVQMKDTSTHIHVDLQRVLAAVQSLAVAAAQVQQDAGQAAEEVRKIARMAADEMAS